MFESALRYASERAAIVRAALEWASGTEAHRRPGYFRPGHEARGMTEADAIRAQRRPRSAWALTR